MAINTTWLYGSYQNDAAFFLAAEEGNRARAYFDQPANPFDGSIAIGVGYDLIQNSRAQIQIDFANAGISISSAQLDLISDARAATNTLRQQEKWSALVAQLNLDLSPAQGRELLKASLPTYEARLTKTLTEQTPMLPQDLQESRERIALLSLRFNGVLTLDAQSGRRSVNTAALIDALNRGDRSEAWYLIRYEFRRYGYAGNNGWALRAFGESATFSLYDPGQPTKDQAIDVYRMYTRHRASIDQFE